MANGWRPNSHSELMSFLAQQQRVQARRGSATIPPLYGEIVDASNAVDNLTPNDMLQIPVEDVEWAEEPPTESPPSEVDTSLGQEIITNGGFEVAANDGTVIGWISLWDSSAQPENPFSQGSEPGEAHSGVGRAVVAVTTGWVNNTAIYSLAAFPVVPGAQYEAKVMVKSTVTGTHYVNATLITAPSVESAELFAFGSTGNDIGTITDPGSSWQGILNRVVVPPNHSYAKLILRVEGTTDVQSGEVSWDDVSLVQLTEGTKPGGVPWYAHPRTKPFDPKDGLYNLTSTSMTPGRLKIAATKGGRSSAILVVGSSTVAGYGSPGLGSWTNRLLLELERDGCPVRGEGPSFVGMAKALANAGEPDTRWSFSGTVTQAPASLWASINNGSWAQWTATRQANAVQIHYLHSGGDFSYSINGAAAVNVVTDGSDTQASVTIAPVTLGLTTVRVTGIEATPAEIVAIDTFRSDVAGLRCYPAGVAGSTSGNFALNGFKNNLYTARNTVVPALTLISVGANDCTLGVSVDDFKENIKATCVWSKLGSSGVGIIIMPHADPNSIEEWVPYASALYDIADSQDVPLLDMTYRWTDLATAISSGLFGSSHVHPGPYGHAEYAHAARRLVY